MVTRRFVLLLTLMFSLSAGGFAADDDLFQVEKRLWIPVADEVYLQEVSHKVTTDGPVQSLAAYNGACYAVVGKTLSKLEGAGLSPVASAPEGIESVEAHGGSLWALAESGLYRFDGSEWNKIDDRKFVDVCTHQGALHATNIEDVFRLEEGKLVDIEPEGGYLSSNKTMVMADGSQVLADPVRFGPLAKIGSYSGTLYALRPGKLVLFDGRIVDQNIVHWGALPSRNTRDMLTMGSRLFVATDRGLGVLRGAAMTALKGPDGLPYEDTTCLAEGFEGDLWIGTSKGAIRMTGDEWHFFGASHWLPGDAVSDIAVSDDTVYVATDRGIGVIRYEPYTLQKKADYYERHIDEWGHKRLGFIHKLFWGGDDLGWVREISDNDGGHTAPYLAAMTYKYAVTGDESAREAAIDSFRAMDWLEDITPKDGFVARSIWSTSGDRHKRSLHGSGGLPAKWYPTDDGLWYWKGDTSSDETDGHYYAVSLFHDLIAEGEDRERAADHLARISSHIIDHGWVLEDMDGKPTRWGRWDRDYLFQPYGFYARGLNGMEAQTYMRASYAMTGDEKYEEAFQQLIDWGYHEYTVDQKITFPPADIAPWDDELAFRCYYTLLRYTEDPRLRSIYLRSIERTWEVKRMEKIAWFNFIYGAITGNDCELAPAVQGLREWTLDCQGQRYTNSHRADLFPEKGYVPYGGGTRGMSPRETQVKGGSRNALPYDGGGGGVQAPTGFLRDYWMGRYHGFIEPPSTSDANLTSVERNRGLQLGAPPYEGPERPEPAGQ